MKRFSLLFVMLGCGLLVACTEDVYNEKRVKEDYTQHFVDLFGSIDANQDWNMAEQKSVMVEPGTVSDIRIYAKNGEINKLVGYYQEISGKQTLTFDAAKAVNDFVVTAGGQARWVKNGESVSFAHVGTRGYETSVEDVFTVNSEYKVFTKEEVMAFANKIPDGENNIGKNGITSNFSMVADERTVTVYPVYWNSAHGHMLGIYWTGEKGVEHVQDIYQDKVNGENAGDDNVQIEINDDWVNANAEEADFDRASRIRARGFTINLPENVTYGFYIKDLPTNYIGWVNDTFYTEAGKNDDEVHASYFTQDLGNGQTRTFLGFEDMGGTGSDYDLNDLVLIIDPAPVVIDHDATSWILAAEDLGATDDYDFNDVVVRVEHVAGQNKATVTPLAAGGTLDVWLYRHDTPIGSGEFHTLLGGSSATYINTQSEGAPGEPIEIEVPQDFTMAYSGSVGNMGGFRLIVEYATGIETATITAPGQGEAPQMICVPGDWKWPKERVSISTAYPGFGTWGSDYSNNSWYLNPVDEYVLGNN